VRCVGCPSNDIMANSRAMRLFWGCMPVLDRQSYFLMLELLALPDPFSLTRALWYYHFRGGLPGAQVDWYMPAWEATNGIIIVADDPSNLEDGYYSKASPVIGQANLCIGAFACLEDEPYTAPLNWINNPWYPIPPP